MAKIFGIDLGTANTLICAKGRGIILRAPSVVAINDTSREIVALGMSAKNMLGKTPEGITAFRPLRGGVIAEYEVASKMVRGFLEVSGAFSIFSRPAIIVCIPHEATGVEKRALEDAIFEAGARSVALIDEPLAAAIGTGLRVGAAKGSMIVDIGGGSTEIAVISHGGIVSAGSVRIAGDQFDDAIVEHLRKTRSTLIGTATAEDLKRGCGSAHAAFDKGEMTVAGRNLLSGLGATIKVSSGEIREAVREPLYEIIDAIKHTLETTPPELSSDIYDYGIMLTGGGAMLRGVDRLISEKTGIKVTVAKRPLEAVCIGISRVLESEGQMGDLLRYRGR
ncbi:MAG: rod shape-determining protein [Ruminococcaceae bacterium]|nr:rod shape-determining protein [Oscillospiraceae bacterium]